jgi:xanthine dehydrogenase accessory factor
VLGTLLAGALDARLPAVAEAPGLTAVDIGDADALAVGLSCGGRAEVFVQDAGQVPAEAWRLLADRRPVRLVTDLRDGRTVIEDDDRIATTTVTVDGDRLIAAYRPVTRLRVVGDGLIADALREISGVLGWEWAGPGGAGPAGDLGPGDALVVLSHDDTEDVPALAAALRAGVGYVGALGSRRTQQRRTAALLGDGAHHGLRADDLARIHGPAGLDIGSATPAEIALAIVAEALAVLRGAPATHLRDRPGPVHRTSPDVRPGGDDRSA